MREISAKEFDGNAFDLIGTTWMLVTAGDERGVNTMTASWGGLGVIWGDPAATIYVRPQRYTKEFIDAQDTFSLSFLDERWRKQLSYLGTVSGRDEDKISQAGLSTAFSGETPYFEEASLVLICRKAYAQDLSESCFADSAAFEKWYPERDLHTMYIGFVEKILVRE